MDFGYTLTAFASGLRDDRSGVRGVSSGGARWRVTLGSSERAVVLSAPPVSSAVLAILILPAGLAGRATDDPAIRSDGPAASGLPPSEPREPAGDPVSNWLTFIGGSGADSAPNVAVDASGDSYVVGSSPAAWGSPVRGHAGGSDAFVARVDATGALRWLTFLGGAGGDYGIDVAVDGSGDVYVTGSSDATWGTPLVAHAGSADAFVARLDSGGVLQWHTFVGGTAGDFPTAIIRDPLGDLVVAGTSSATWGSPLNAHAGGGDAFVAKLDTSGARRWNTFMGGIRDDAANGITADQAGNVFATGSSKATWGTPINPFTLDNYADVFLAKLSADGTRTWHTFQNKYSGLSSYGRKVAVALSGEIYVGGYTSIGVTTWGFVRKFTAGGAYAQMYEFGTAAQTVMVSGLVLDPAGNVYVAGRSSYSWGSPVMPYTAGTDAFVARLCANFTLKWHAFLGGSGVDYGLGIATGLDGNLHVVGTSDASWGSPVAGHSGAADGFLAVLSDPQTTSVAVTSPDGGESWIAGTTHDIQWTSTGSVANVKIEYSANNGSSWSAVIASTPNDGAHPWSVPNSPTTLGRVRVTDTADACCSDGSNAAFTVAPALTVTSPNGGESWTMGSTQAVTWTSAGTAANVKVEYSTNGGSSWTTAIASTPNTGSYLWTTPVTATAQALVRVSDAANAAVNDTSDAVFTLTLATITVLAPNGGETWPVGAPRNIAWTWTGSIAAVRIDVSTNNGADWTPVVVSTANTGLYPGVVPNAPSAQCLVRVSDAADAGVFDTSNAPFTIDATPTLVVTAPNGGEAWMAGSAHTIAWSSYGAAVADVRLGYLDHERRGVAGHRGPDCQRRGLRVDGARVSLAPLPRPGQRGGRRLAGGHERRPLHDPRRRLTCRGTLVRVDQPHPADVVRRVGGRQPVDGLLALGAGTGRRRNGCGGARARGDRQRVLRRDLRERHFPGHRDDHVREHRVRDLHVQQLLPWALRLLLADGHVDCLGAGAGGRVPERR